MINLNKEAAEAEHEKELMETGLIVPRGEELNTLIEEIRRKNNQLGKQMNQLFHGNGPHARWKREREPRKVSYDRSE